MDWRKREQGYWLKTGGQIQSIPPSFQLACTHNKENPRAWFVYEYFTILSGVYLFSLTLIVQAIFPSKRNLKRTVLFFSGLIVLHSAGLRWLLLHVPGADFRIEAGVPVYGDFYSIPYTDEEVITWYSRFLNAKHFYESGDWSLLTDLMVQGVTHVVLPEDFAESCPGLLTPVYKDNAYQVLAYY